MDGTRPHLFGRGDGRVDTALAVRCALAWPALDELEALAVVEYATRQL